MTVKTPTSSFHLPISVYKVYSYTVPVNSSFNHATQLMNICYLTLNTKDNQHYASITSQQLSQCKGTTILFCSFNIALTASASPSCLSAVFLNHKEIVSKLCDFRFLTNMLPTAMYELSPSHLLLYRTTIIALDCANGQRIVMACIANIWRTFQRSHRISLHLELTTGSPCELFTLLTLLLCPHNWKIQTPEDISSVHITTSYFILHYLHLQSPTFSVTNTHTNSSIDVPTTILISPFRNILKHPYTAYVLMSHHNFFQIL